MLLNSLKWLLFPLSGIYSLVTFIRNLLYDLGFFKIIKVSVPVIAVGNITAGGTGKTPFVIALAEFLSERGLRVGIITRGYRRQSRGQVVVSDGKQILSNPRQAGDEPYLIARNVPNVIVIADTDRIAAALTAIEKYACEVIIADDAFQHRRLARDLNIVLWDAQIPAKQRHLLPVGRLRESLRGLRRADFLVFSRSDEVDKKQKLFLNKYNPRMSFFNAPLVISALDSLTAENDSSVSIAGKNVLGFCGLGNHVQFENTVRQLRPGKDIFRRFPDHHRYTFAEFHDLITIGRNNNCDCLLTTEKDAVNLPEFESQTLPILVLKIKFELDEKIRAAILRNLPPLTNFTA